MIFFRECKKRFWSFDDEGIEIRIPGCGGSKIDDSILLFLIILVLSSREFIELINYIGMSEAIGLK